MENNLNKAYSEVYSILNLMDNYYVEKIPMQLREIIKNERQEDYEPEIKTDVPLDEQKLQNKTFSILAMLNLNYWCESEEEKQELIKLYAGNDEKKEAEIREKYNPDNIFNNNASANNSNENTAMVEYKESFIKKIIDKIKNFFKRK